VDINQTPPSGLSSLYLLTLGAIWLKPQSSGVLAKIARQRFVAPRLRSTRQGHPLGSSLLGGQHMAVRMMHAEDDGQAWRADMVGRVATYAIGGVFGLAALYVAVLYFLSR
jgi:hypothetical protein